MSKAEKFIEEHTNYCSSDIIGWNDNGLPVYKPWLTPDQARKAVKIAKEEIIKKVVLYIIYNTRTVHYNNYDTREFNKSSLNDIINDLKQAMKDG